MGGRPKDVADEDILKAVKLAFGPGTAGDVMEAVDLNRSGSNKRLTKLHERGLIHRKKVGSNAVVYWLTDDGERYLQQRTEAFRD